jgi:hypothetical protein
MVMMDSDDDDDGDDAKTRFHVYHLHHLLREERSHGGSAFQQPLHGFLRPSHGALGRVALMVDGGGDDDGGCDVW